ncbi:MAG: hypothetical protein J6J44_14240 [Lachnospiraceae bacterium]|nr:hypothetical protein [Lachnospiraceae bacterium]
MQKRKIILVISVMFYLTMGVLALCSRGWYQAGLPKVRIFYLDQRAFREDRTYHYLPALPESYYGQTLYYVQRTYKNKELCYVVAEAKDVVLGKEENGYYAVEDGLTVYLPLIVDPSGDIAEGQEVLVENEEDFLW